jgi:hypothetical protein
MSRAYSPNYSSYRIIQFSFILIFTDTKENMRLVGPTERVRAASSHNTQESKLERELEVDVRYKVVRGRNMY